MADRGTRLDRRVSVSCRSSKHRRTIARTALGSRTRNSPSKSYSIPGSQHEPDELSLDDLRGRHIRKFGCLCSVREWRRTDAINRWRVNDLDTKHDLRAGGHGSRRTFLITVEEDERAQV